MVVMPLSLVLSTPCRSAETPEINRLFPLAQVELVNGAGHWVHIDRPKDLLNLVSTFLTKDS